MSKLGKYLIFKMASNKPLSTQMRILHRYLGFFLVGIMSVYAISGIILIFRDTDFLKQEKKISKQIQANAPIEELGKLLEMKQPKVEKEDADFVYFENGTYNKNTGAANYTVKKLPLVLDKMTHLHKAKTKDSLFVLNIFFGLSLFFFVISSFWMFLPGTTIFKKGLYFTIGGMVLTLLLLFI